MSKPTGSLTTHCMAQKGQEPVEATGTPQRREALGEAAYDAPRRSKRFDDDSAFPVLEKSHERGDAPRLEDLELGSAVVLGAGREDLSRSGADFRRRVVKESYDDGEATERVEVARKVDVADVLVELVKESEYLLAIFFILLRGSLKALLYFNEPIGNVNCVMLDCVSEKFHSLWVEGLSGRFVWFVVPAIVAGQYIHHDLREHR